MSKYELKTKLNNASVEKFLKSVKDKKRQEDCFKLLDILTKVTKEEPKMWGSSIVGFGSYHYKYESGHEGDMMLAGFSPRKDSFSLYIMYGGASNYKSYLKSLANIKQENHAFI